MFVGVRVCALFLGRVGAWFGAVASAPAKAIQAVWLSARICMSSFSMPCARGFVEGRRGQEQRHWADSWDRALGLNSMFIEHWILPPLSNKPVSGMNGQEANLEHKQYIDSG